MAVSQKLSTSKLCYLKDMVLSVRKFVCQLKKMLMALTDCLCLSLCHSLCLSLSLSFVFYLLCYCTISFLDNEKIFGTPMCMMIEQL